MSASAAEAVRLFQAGRVAEAEALARGLIARDARDAEALHLLACIRGKAGARDEALEWFGRALAVEPRNASYLNNRAQILLEAGRAAEAARDLALAVEILPSFHAARIQLGHALLRASQPAAAESAFRTALAAAPNNASLHNSLGVALQRQGRADDAIAHFRRALEIDPGFAGVLLNWGNALETAGDLEGARARYREVIARDPASAPAWLNAASIAVDLGRSAEAREAYARVLELKPASADARYGLGLLELREQHFAEGWEGFERRFDTDPPQSTRRGPALAALTREDLARRVAVWNEQGIGDQVLYSTLLPELRDAGAHVVAEVDPRLLDAYRRSVPGIEFVATEAPRAFAACERQVALGSLAHLLRPDAASFARQPRALLHADPARVEAIRAALGEGPHVAISWRSVQRGARAKRAERKSGPLEHFAVLARQGVRLVDVQYGDVEEERARFERDHPGLLVRVPGLDAFSDLEGVMAAIAACGRVVTVSNVVAHLAGALGVRADVVFLGALAPFHYWDAVAGTRSLWYPSVRIATDPAWHGWRQALDALSARFDR